MLWFQVLLVSRQYLEERVSRDGTKFLVVLGYRSGGHEVKDHLPPFHPLRRRALKVFNQDGHTILTRPPVVGGIAVCQELLVQRLKAPGYGRPPQRC